MQQIIAILWILGPLLIGFFCKIKSSKGLRFFNFAVDISVYLILLIIGLGLSQLGNLGQELVRILWYASAFIVMIISANLLCLVYFDKKSDWQLRILATHSNNKYKTLLSSFKQVGLVVTGVILGLLLPEQLLPPEPEGIIQYFLMLLLFSIGIILRSAGISLRHILLNKRALKISIIFIVSSLFAGAITGYILGAGFLKGLAISSGMGWYSLSGSIIGTAYGPFWGSVALLNDLVREIIALIFIPVIMRYAPSAAIGLGGATSLDFTLPTIRQSGGLDAVPIAISFGFVINIISPILMILFSNI